MSDDRWIEIPRWDDYQHYGRRDPIWIKDYRSQLNNGAYLNLSFHLRGILHGLRLAYADNHGQLVDNTATLTRQLGHRVMTRDLESLNHAGLIQFVASKPLALEKRRVEKKDRASAKPQERLPFNGQLDQLNEPDRPPSYRTNAGAYRKNDTAFPAMIEPDAEMLRLIEDARRRLGKGDGHG